MSHKEPAESSRIAAGAPAPVDGEQKPQESQAESTETAVLRRMLATPPKPKTKAE